MCGRFTLRASVNVVAEQFALFEAGPFEPRFNIAPSQPVPVIRLSRDPEPRRELAWLRWGLIPPWAKDPAIGNRMINARAETVAEKPAYRAAFKQQRCLIAADGFYEWQRMGKSRQPYFIRMHDDRPFGFAGLWESWQAPDSSRIESCTILTTEPNDLLRPIHNRMPVIVGPDQYDAWLDPAAPKPDLLESLGRPHPSDSMTAIAVGKYVNSPAHDDPKCIEPSTDGLLF